MTYEHQLIADFDIEKLSEAAQYPEQKRACENLQSLIDGVQNASSTVIELQEASIENVKLKMDGSPTSDADDASHEILKTTLTNLFEDTPLGGEELGEVVTKEVLQGTRLWLTDGLDGTKEYLARKDDYAVCAGLLEEVDMGNLNVCLVPTFGIISAPARNELYFGGPGLGSYKIGSDGSVKEIKVSAESTGIVLASLSHPNPQSDEYIKHNYPNANIEDRGSVYKLLMIAEGLADACPRINVTMKGWDIAAGHAILVGAGGSLARPNGGLIDYRQIIIPDFVASR